MLRLHQQPEAYLAGQAWQAIAAALEAHPALAPALMSYMRPHNTPPETRD